MKTFLTRFEGEGNPQATGNGSQNAGYTYEQLEEIASAREERAGRAALADFFRKKGLDEEGVTAAIEDYKEHQKQKQPNISAIEAERDSYKQKVEHYENRELLTKKNVSAEFMDFVQFEASKLVTDKKTFEQAVDQYLKDNPKYTTTGMRVDTGVSGGSGESETNANSEINNMIRGALRK